MYGTVRKIFHTSLAKIGNHKMKQWPQSEIKVVALVEMWIGKIFQVVTSTLPVIIMHENNHIQLDLEIFRKTSH